MQSYFFLSYNDSSVFILLSVLIVHAFVQNVWALRCCTGAQMCRVLSVFLCDAYFLYFIYLNVLWTDAFQFVKHADAHSKCLKHDANCTSDLIETRSFSVCSNAFKLSFLFRSLRFDCVDHVLICFVNFRHKSCAVFKSVWNIIHFVCTMIVDLRYDIRKRMIVSIKEKKRNSVDVTYGCLRTFKSDAWISSYVWRHSRLESMQTRWNIYERR